MEMKIRQSAANKAVPRIKTAVIDTWYAWLMMLG